jgi:polysaccharide export outer membrane protein
MKINFFKILFLVLLTSCASKKDVLYIQDADVNNSSNITYQNATIQPNDILKISVETLIPEAAVPYNRGANSGALLNSLELIKLNGYLVENDGTISFPILGEMNVSNLTTFEVEKMVKKLLVDGGHLNNPSVDVRLLNAKITILGEVNAPGTYNFTEQNITIFQAIGYAGDLTINGKRDDVIITRDVNGIRTISHIDLTSTEFMNSEYYYIKPNDTVIVNPNNPRVKNAGFVGNVGTVLTIASLLLSSIILLTR